MGSSIIGNDGLAFDCMLGGSMRHCCCIVTESVPDVLVVIGLAFALVTGVVPESFPFPLAVILAAANLVVSFNS